MAKLGWIGMGDIGTPMVLRLIDAGHEVTVWGRNKERLCPALEKGAIAGRSPADLAASCDAVFLCVTDSDAVEQIVFAAEGIASVRTAGKLLVDHSTIHPEQCRIMAQRLRSQGGMCWVDAPVSGGASGAKSGTLSIFAGGEATDVDRARPWMAAYGSNITHMGPQGFGQATKSCNQAILFATIAAWAEVLGYADRFGLDPTKMADALAGGFSDSVVRKVHVPIMISAQFPHHTARLMLKDLNIVTNMAHITQSPMPVSTLVESLVRKQIELGYEMTGPMGLVCLYANGPLTRKK